MIFVCISPSIVVQVGTLGTLFGLLLPHQTAVRDIAFPLLSRIQPWEETSLYPFCAYRHVAVSLVLPNMYIDVDFHIHNAVQHLIESIATTEVVQAGISPWVFTTPHPP